MVVDRKEFGNHVKWLCSKKNTEYNPNRIYTQAAFLRFLDGRMSQTNISKIFSGEISPMLNEGGNVELILEAFPTVTPEWLLGFDEPSNIEITAELNHIQDELFSISNQIKYIKSSIELNKRR